MKTVFTNKMACHVWAQQSQEEGKGSKGSVFFHDKAIYSYGYHFPMAVFLTPDLVLVNDSTYSTSTSKHQSYTRQVINHKTRIYSGTEVVKACVDNQYQTPEIRNIRLLEVLTAYTIQKTEYRLKEALGTKSKIKKTRLIGEAVGFIENAGVILSSVGIKFPQELQARLDALTADNLDVLGDFKKQQDKEEQQKLRRIKAQKKKDEKNTIIASELWKDHKPLQIKPELSGLLYRSENVYLRVNFAMDEPLLVETSKGAEMPVKFAKAIWNQVRKCAMTKTEWKTNGHKLPAGVFQIDSIDVDGNIKAGCHFIKFHEIARVANILGLV